MPAPALANGKLPAAVGAAAMLTLVFSLGGCAGPARTAAAAAPPVPPGQARIWFYRQWEPSVSRNVANVMLNGAPAGSVLPSGPGMYRDVPPGHYLLSAQTYNVDTNQTREVDLVPGQEVFAKILAVTDNSSEGDLNSFKRDDFYVWLVSPQVAQAEIAANPG